MVDRTTLPLFIIFLLIGSTLEQQTVRLTNRADRTALLQLRSSLGLRAREWPIKGDPCLNWAGIQCLDGFVTGINISGFRRTRAGSQNPQFGVDALVNFTRLEVFNASRFSLPGSIPAWFGDRVGGLTVLDLRSCLIVGSIPDSIGNMTNLTSIYLSDNNLVSSIPASLSQLLSLTVLDLSRNTLVGVIPPGIGALSSLRIVNLSRNNLSSSIPGILGDLSSLVDLDLSFNSFTGPVSPDLGGLTSLRRMLIGDNFLSGALPGNLFTRLSGLQILVMNSNELSGELPDELLSMGGLRLVDASGNNFTGTLPSLSGNGNASVAVFNLSGNQFYGSLGSILRRFSTVDLSRNYFQGRVPDYASGNVSLDRNCLQNVAVQRSVAECESFYTERGLRFDNFGLPNAQQPPPSSSDRNRRRRTIILAGVLGGLGVIVLLVILVVVLILCTRRRGTADQRGTGAAPVPSDSTAATPPPGVPLNFSSLGDGFTYQQILQATGDFSDVNLIKHGHSGDLFRGVLESGGRIVIKRVDLGSVKKESYMIELDVFTKVCHPRLVPLLGHCLENENEKFLIYKYMPNGDLSSSLFRKANSEDDSLQSLDWITRLKIAIGAAEGLSYLHHECSPPLVHRDVQASSILLDDKFEVRLGSLSEVCTQEGDTHQNRISRLLRFPQTSEQGASGTPTATCAYDVYCFGKVLLELVTGKLGISACSDGIGKDWLEGTLPYISIYDKELVTNILDPSLIIDEDLLEEVWAMAIVARSCLNPKPSRRPLMRYILKALENPLKVVREENTGSARLRTTSSRGSWNAALFGSWRHSSFNVASVPAVPANRVEGSSHKNSGSQGSGQNNGGDHSSSNRRSSRDIFPEPLDAVDRPNED